MKINDLFEMIQGNGLELLNMNLNDNSNINFISRTSQNNGVIAKVDKFNNIEPFPPGLITVALGGSVLSAFVQRKPFYTAFHIMVLKPKRTMTLKEKLFYAMCIKQNAYRYSYGRQANKTLKDIELPDNLPKWLYDYKINFSVLDTKSNINDNLLLTSWKEFKLIDFFEMKAGKYYSKDDYSCGETPLISSKDTNNGVMAFTNLKPEFNGNCITIGKVDISTFYQEKPFCATSDVTVLIPKISFNQYIGLFIKTIIEMDKYRWCYGRQIRLGDCKKISIKLPSKDGLPDFTYMEKYIKKLPYADKI